MIKQIILTFIAVLGICIYISSLDKEELSGNHIIINKQYLEGQKAGSSHKLNSIKWILNKNYRRGYIWGINNEKI